MSRIQSEVTYIKNQREIKLNEKSQSWDVGADMAEMLKWSDKDFKAATMKMLYWTIINTLAINENT